MTGNIDWNVGRVAARLAELDLADNTIVVYLTDNGPNGWRWNGVSLKPLLGRDADAACQWPDRRLVNQRRGRTSVRSQRYRLDHEGRLFDMVTDPGQETDIASRQPDAAARLTAVRDAFISDVLPELPDNDTRPFPIGDPDHPFTHLPARDGIASGGIHHSSRNRNDSYFTNWTSTEDAIAWDVEVMADSRFEVVLYYTCSATDVGALVELRLG